MGLHKAEPTCCSLHLIRARHDFLYAATFAEEFIDVSFSGVKRKVSGIEPVYSSFLVIFPVLHCHPGRVGPSTGSAPCWSHCAVHLRKVAGHSADRWTGTPPPRKPQGAHGGGRSAVVINYYVYFLHVLSAHVCFTQWVSIFKSIQVHKYLLSTCYASATILSTRDTVGKEIKFLFLCGSHSS